MVAYFAFNDLATGFALLAFLSFLDTCRNRRRSASSKASGLLLALAWLARFSVSGRGERDFFADHAQLTWAMIAFFGWAVLTLAWAVNRATASPR